MQEIIAFLRELAANNNREWFAANKARYDAVRAKIFTLSERLIEQVALVDPSASALTPEQCTYRIYRDTRFSSDKTPYKTHIGIFINPPRGKKSITMGYYLHIEPDNVFFCGGTIGLPSPVLKAVREAIYDNIEEYLGIIDDPDFRKYLPLVGDNLLKTAPKGFPKDWKYIDLIRPRDYVACSSPLPCDISLDAMPAFLSPYIVQARRFNAFHNFTIEEYL
ncbi:MAG: DUF2461 domain-containing protein [Muribaculaceae bacterium]|nr:DUF2461 domain-containing protein [Muribaculaceae bacterium]